MDIQVELQAEGLAGFYLEGDFFNDTMLDAVSAPFKAQCKYLQVAILTYEKIKIK